MCTGLSKFTVFDALPSCDPTPLLASYSVASIQGRLKYVFLIGLESRLATLHLRPSCMHVCRLAATAARVRSMAGQWTKGL